jgi:drug/metabolite transporter (DMT)-like permease
MAIGAFWFSVMGLLVRLAGERLPSMEIVLFRGIITLVLSYGAVRAAGIASPWGTQRRLLLARGVLGAVALSCFYFSLTHLPLGEATLIQYTNPVFATLFAARWVGERVGAGEVVSLLASIAGVVLITQPGGAAAPPFPAWYVGVALAGAACSGTAYGVVRKMGAGEHSSVVVFYLPLIAVPLAIPFALAHWVMPVGREWALLAAVGVTTQVAQTYMTRALQLESAARATTTGYLQIVFAGLWGALLLGERPTAWSIAGAVVIVGSTLLLAVRRTAVGVGDE